MSLRIPDDNMTPEEKGALLLDYLNAGYPVGGLNFKSANLNQMRLDGASLDGIDLVDARLFKTSLCGASLIGANLEFAYLTETDFSGARLTGANLSRARMSGTVLRGVNLSTVSMEFAQATAATYVQSCWTPELLLDLMLQNGLNTVNLHEFPEAAQDACLGPREGLTIFLAGRMSTLNRAQLEETIRVTLGDQTDVYVAEYHVHVSGSKSRVRLRGSRVEDLFKVADVIEAIQYVVGQPDRLEQMLAHSSAQLEKLCSVVIPAITALEIWWKTSGVPEHFEKEVMRSGELARTHHWLTPVADGVGEVLLKKTGVATLVTGLLRSLELGFEHLKEKQDRRANEALERDLALLELREAEEEASEGERDK